MRNPYPYMKFQNPSMHSSNAQFKSYAMHQKACSVKVPKSYHTGFRSYACIKKSNTHIYGRTNESEVICSLNFFEFEGTTRKM